MDQLALIVDFVLHVNVHLQSLMNNYGLWVYAILFLIIFCETGLVVTPFLPGDSLLFAAGALTVGTALDVHTLAILLVTAAVLGNLTNYTIGTSSVSACTAIPTQKSSAAIIWPKPRTSSPSTVARR